VGKPADIEAQQRHQQAIQIVDARETQPRADHRANRRRPGRTPAFVVLAPVEQLAHRVEIEGRVAGRPSSTIRCLRPASR